MPGKKRAKIYLQTPHSETYIEAIINVVHEPLVILSEDFLVKNANASFFSTFRLQRSKNIGKNFFKIARGAWSIPEVREFVNGIQGSHLSQPEIEIRFKKEGGSEKTLRLNGRKARSRGNSEPLLLVVFEDVTLERKFAEQQVEQKNIREENQRLHQMSRQKDDFISMASHELKTPITSIKAFAQILEKDFFEEGNTNAANMLARMNVQIVKLTGLIGDLLDVSRMDTGKLHYHFENFDLRDLVLEVVKEVQLSIKSHKIICDLADFPVIKGDRDRIGQVLTNFLTNAVKYSPGENEIYITNELSKKFATVFVKDNGMGIPKPKQSKVFDKFFRVHELSENKYPGIGLGLYISSEIIKKHEGKIGVKSEPGKGATFFFRLPLQTPQASSTD